MSVSFFSLGFNSNTAITYVQVSMGLGAMQHSLISVELCQVIQVNKIVLIR